MTARLEGQRDEAERLADASVEERLATQEQAKETLQRANQRTAKAVERVEEFENSGDEEALNTAREGIEDGRKQSGGAIEQLEERPRRLTARGRARRAPGRPRLDRPTPCPRPPPGLRLPPSARARASHPRGALIPRGERHDIGGGGRHDSEHGDEAPPGQDRGLLGDERREQGDGHSPPG
jgi:hypothetical protein